MIPNFYIKQRKEKWMKWRINCENRYGIHEVDCYETYTQARKALTTYKEMSISWTNVIWDERTDMNVSGAGGTFYHNYLDFKNV